MELLGDYPHAKDRKVQLIRREEKDNYVLESLMLQLNEEESVPAYVAKPLNKEGPLPIVLFNHSHGGNFDQGKEELLISNSYLQSPSFVEAITTLGYAVGSIDMWGFNERKGKLESELVKEMLLDGRSLWGMRIFDNIAFLDYLVDRPDIDQNRVATIGMSMGGLMSWWMAALDERIKVTVDIAAQVHIETLRQKRGLDHHGFYYYVPGFLKQFSTLAVQSLIVPRPRLSLVGKDDRMCPLEGVMLLDEELGKIYGKYDAKNQWNSQIVTGGHQETKEMRKQWENFLQKHL
ncbi:hydrolase [Niallia circulans]|uniref:dienelactone hydrolase family protein n=1 Tax=unclassified Niallia TaxID=2837522 RepID=UPI000F6A23ED|nr:prolyl oligopeptidase family serine peptidase [Niallia circulans]AYV70009.1 hydrolase [Niallia circulans]MED3840215.1 prolyl oligopeptidase family serine peptidase [Niallia circulans]MED4241903.1 prolyl oligopeptidase family serine peptidase [Niallia circulans]MED4250147.1 prolyl oligopeptidase family serine peptidase [Niallia circulans]UQZ77632.1 hydrolase [Niallia circulans]